MMNVLKWRKQIQADLDDRLGLGHEALGNYAQLYGLDSLDCRVELVRLDGGRDQPNWVGWHFSQPDKEPEGYALVTHGLFDHTAYMRPLIASLLGQNLNVLSLELPGHGLDFKGVLECDTFDEYTEQNKKAVEWVIEQRSSVIVEVAHSTGAVAFRTAFASAYRRLSGSGIFKDL